MLYQLKNSFQGNVNVNVAHTFWTNSMIYVTRTEKLNTIDLLIFYWSTDRYGLYKMEQQSSLEERLTEQRWSFQRRWTAYLIKSLKLLNQLYLSKLIALVVSLWLETSRWVKLLFSWMTATYNGLCSIWIDSLINTYRKENKR